VPEDNALAIVFAWKQDDWTSVATLAGMVELLDIGITAGDDVGVAIDYAIQTAKADVAAGAFVVTGGVSAISRGVTAVFAHADFLNEQTASMTPVLDQIWLKSVTRPFLNRRVVVTGWSDIERPDRGADFDAVNRTLPVAVTDVRGSRRYTLELYAGTHEDAQTMDYVLASGDVLFVHTPRDCEVPGGYVRVLGTGERRPHVRASSRVFALPVVEVAAPGPDVLAAISTWQTVLNSYATWADLLAANPTWADLLARVAPPSEVIVP
jgi:hypothetical protein